MHGGAACTMSNFHLKKICLVNNLFPPYAQGGTEVVVQQTIEILLQSNYRVVLITSQSDYPLSGRWSTDINDHLIIYRYKPKNIYYYTDGARKSLTSKLLWHGIDMLGSLDIKTIQSILRREQPDLVHGHNLKGISYAFPKACHQLSIPYFHSLHNYQLLHPFGTFTYQEKPPDFKPRLLAKLYRQINRIIFRNTAGVVSPTRLPLIIHQNAGFFSNIPTMIMPSPVTAPKEMYSPILDGKLKLVYLGALEEIKGIRTLINALLKILSQNVYLDIYGEGSLFHELQAATQKSSHIRFLGHLDDKDLLGKYDALVYPSICYETQGLSIAESLIRGTPVIASNIGSIPETIQNNSNGYLFTSGNEQELASLLLKCLREPKQLLSLRPAALQSGKQFNQNSYREQLLSFYNLSVSR